LPASRAPRTGLIIYAHGNGELIDMRAADFAPLPDDVVALYDDASVADGELIFQPPRFDKPAA
jgi:hypothetical protein